MLEALDRDRDLCRPDAGVALLPAGGRGLPVADPCAVEAFLVGHALGADRWIDVADLGLQDEARDVATCGLAGSFDTAIAGLAFHRVDEKSASFVDIAGDDVQRVLLAAAGGRDVHGLRVGGISEDPVPDVDGRALHAVLGRCVRQVRVLLDILAGQLRAAAVAADGHYAVPADAGDGPGVAVGDAELAIVATGHDAITDA